MEEIKLKDPIWVARPAGLDRALRALSRQNVLAVDTESNSLFAYREQVCLIQFSTDLDDYLIDPLALTDLSPLGPIFADPGVEKIFHAAEYDLICLKRDFGFQVRNLFDTMVASRILGRQAVGLGSLLKEEFGIELDKRYQRANWGQRPLPPALLSYARYDTHFLVDLRQRMQEELIHAGRWELAQEDFRRMENVAVPENDTTAEGLCWRIAGSHELSVRQMAILHELCRYRDREARAANLPHFKVISNEVLLQVAQAAPSNLEELAANSKLSPKQLERFGNGLLAAVRAGQFSDPPHRPHNHRPDDAFLARLDALRNWRKITGRELGVESDVILPRETMEMIAQANPRSAADLATLLDDLPWRLEHFGEAILKVLNPSDR
jgi:ribonuclease D